MKMRTNEKTVWLSILQPEAACTEDSFIDMDSDVSEITNFPNFQISISQEWFPISMSFFQIMKI